MKFTKRAIAIGVAFAATVAAGLGVAITVDGASAASKVHHLKFVAVTIGEHNTGHFTFVSTEVNRHHGKVVGYDTSSEKFNFHTQKPFLWVVGANRPSDSAEGPASGFASPQLRGQ